MTSSRHRPHAADKALAKYVPTVNLGISWSTCTGKDLHPYSVNERGLSVFTFNERFWNLYISLCPPRQYLDWNLLRNFRLNKARHDRLGKPQTNRFILYNIQAKTCLTSHPHISDYFVINCVTVLQCRIDKLINSVITHINQLFAHL